MLLRPAPQTKRPAGGLEPPEQGPAESAGIAEWDDRLRLAIGRVGSQDCPHDVEHSPLAVGNFARTGITPPRRTIGIFGGAACGLASPRRPSPGFSFLSPRRSIAGEVVSARFVYHNAPAGLSDFVGAA